MKKMLTKRPSSFIKDPAFEKSKCNKGTYINLNINDLSIFSNHSSSLGFCQTQKTESQSFVDP